MITPIQTRYKGYLFRSRLEARWAVFFDAAGIRWLYEEQGFNINGKLYLPDFHLPDFGYFEVKGKYSYDDELMQSFATEIGSPLFVAFDEIPNPESDAGYLKSFIPAHWPDDVTMYWGSRDMFLKCDTCGRIKIQNEAYSTVKDNCCEKARQLTLYSALSQARAARFEHGQTSSL